MEFNKAYFETLFRVGSEVAREELLEMVRNSEGNIALITAYATTGETWTQEENDEATENLLVDLGGHLPCYGITGYSPITQHGELGFAMEMDLEKAIELGKKYLQDAIYCVRNGELYLHTCREDGPKPQKVGVFQIEEIG